MLLRYEVTKKDYEALVYSDLKARSPFKATGGITAGITIFLIPALCLIVLKFAAGGILTGILTPLMIPAILGLLVAVFANNRVLAILTTRERIKTGAIDPQYFGSHTLELTEDSILLSYGTLRNEYVYSGLHRIAVYNGAAVIFTSAKMCILVPGSAFGNAEERRTFQSLIQAKMAAGTKASVAVPNADKADAGLILEYEWAEKPFIDAMIAGNRLYFKTKAVWTPGRVISLAVSLFLVCVSITRIIQAFLVPGNFDLLMLLVTFLILLFAAMLQMNLIMVFTPWIKTILKQQLAGDIIPKDTVGRHVLCVGDDKFTLYSSLSAQDTPLGQIVYIRRNKDALFLLLKGGNIVAVPLSAFRSEEELREVIARLQP